MTPSNVPHQKLIDGLNYHVLRQEIDRDEATQIIDIMNENYPEPTSSVLDEAILFQVRKDWGLAPPPQEIK